MLTCIVLSLSVIGRQTVRDMLEGSFRGVEVGSWHQSRSFSMHSAVDSGISNSPGAGYIADMRLMVAN